MASHLSKRIRYLREKKGFSQKFVAQKLDIKNNTLSGYESSRREPDNEMLSKIAEFYNVTTDYLLGRSNHPQLTEVEIKERDSDVEEWMKIIESLPEDERKEIEDEVSNYVKYLVDKKQSDKN